MLIRICVIVAILAALAAGVINFVSVQEKITKTRNERDSEKSQKEEAKASLEKTGKELADTKAVLDETKTELASAITEKDKALNERDTANKRATQLTDELAKTKAARDDALADVAAFRGTGLTPPEILAMKGQLKKTEDNLVGAMVENKKLGTQIEKLKYRLAKYDGEKPIVYLPGAIKGKVETSDPKWDFVVLDIGEDQGVKQDGELLVSRNGKLVAKVIVSGVQKDRCIANVMSGWKLGEVLEGDQVIPAHPAL